MISVIAAIDQNGVLAVDGKIPWYYKHDLLRFKQVTMGAILVMGRKTWETLPKRMPGRRLVVVSRSASFIVSTRKPPAAFAGLGADAEAYPKVMGDMLQELEKQQQVYVIGGGEIYKLAFQSRVVDAVDLTIVPDLILAKDERVTRFPMPELSAFQLVGGIRGEDGLRHLRYERRHAKDVESPEEDAQLLPLR